MNRRFGRPPMIALAHGSRDPRSAATIEELVGVIRDRQPGLDVRTAFLDLSAPRLVDVLGALHAEGHREAVVVPLLLGSAYHARVDIPGALSRAATRFPLLNLRVADVLGPDPRLDDAVLRRLVEAGVDLADDSVGVVLAGAGSSHTPANDAVAAVVRRLTRRTRWRATTAAFAAAADPDVPAAIAALRARGATTIGLGSWFLAPGRLPDRVSTQAREVDAAVRIAAPLGTDIAEIVIDRYLESLHAEQESRYA
ncbi:MAG TPA: CbiX/SirB N-terminal domain-containing protein [Pseudonocardiaceae bacterium]|jgi:sirohydrochlorin ferrochelatase|nr:CbiX/SirB N-terminal domain-containing protein [Pseudonocardiaceae bacterium]